MIIPVKKIDILLHQSNRDSFLEGLQDVGVVDINIDTLEATEELTDSLAELAQVENIIKRLKSSETNASQMSAAEVVIKAAAIDAELEEIGEKIERTKQLVNQINPWGNFEPSVIEGLNKAGYPCRFWSISAKKYVPSSGVFNVGGNGSSLLLFSVGKDNAPEDADEVRLDLHSLNELNNELAKLKERKDTLESNFELFGSNLESLSKYRNELQEKLDLGKAKLIGQNPIGGSLLHYTGWVPDENIEKVKTYLSSLVAVYFFSEPQEGDTIPVALKNNAFSRLFEPVTKIFALPDYMEVDPTPFFAPFFAFFFGMCLGDVGYGFLLLIIGMGAFLKAGEQFKAISLLVMVLGTSTAVAGLFLNTLFGMSIWQYTEGASAIIQSPSPVAFLAANNGTAFPAMPFAMYLGFVQVMLGVLLQSFIKLKSKGVAYALQPIANVIIIIGVALLMINIDFIDLGSLSIGSFKIGETLKSIPSNITNGVILGGIAMMLLTNNPEKPIYLRPLFGLWEFYTFSTGLMGDILSYLRLFALGLAGGLLGNAFNGIALMFIPMENGVRDWATPMVLVAALVFIIGHTINFCLSSLGAFVHPLRLTFVEFYKNLEFKGGARPYAPFKK